MEDGKRCGLWKTRGTPQTPAAGGSLFWEWGLCLLYPGVSSLPEAQGWPGVPARRTMKTGRERAARADQACEDGVLGVFPALGPSASLSCECSPRPRESQARPRRPAQHPHPRWVGASHPPSDAVSPAPANTTAKVKINTQREFIYLFN